MELNGQIALVTGAAQGLGAATARKFGAAGAKVIALDRDPDGATEIAREIGGVEVSCDVADAEAVDHALENAVQAIGGAPRVVVNCAGVADAARIVGRDGSTSFDVFEKVLRVNLFGTYNVMSHAVRRMMALEPLADSGRGVVIITSSAAYEDGQVGQAAYAASKGALASMCLPAARELARVGIRVVAIAPGLFRTPMMEALPEEVTEGIVEAIPFPARLGQGQEFASLAAEVVGNDYLNGTVIRLDAGARLPPR